MYFCSICGCEQVFRGIRSISAGIRSCRLCHASASLTEHRVVAFVPFRGLREELNPWPHPVASPEVLSGDLTVCHFTNAPLEFQTYWNKCEHSRHQQEVVGAHFGVQVARKAVQFSDVPPGLEGVGSNMKLDSHEVPFPSYEQVDKEVSSLRSCLPSPH